jgi:hypothetical protein
VNIVNANRCYKESVLIPVLKRSDALTSNKASTSGEGMTFAFDRLMT